MDVFNVGARHIGLRLVGSIEIIQFFIIAAISSALLLATLEAAHAAVHLLVTRVGPRARAVLKRASDAFSIGAFLLLLAGNIWALTDLLPLDERSDLLHLPFAPARTLFCLSLALCALVAAVQLVSAHREDPPSDV